MQNIAKWNAKHFLVDMFKDVLHPRIRTAYYKQLQLMHIDCNWSFDPVDFIHLKSEFGFESLAELNGESWDYIMTQTSVAGFIYKHHEDCQTVHKSYNTYLLEPSLVDRYVNEASSIIERQTNYGTELINGQLKTASVFAENVLIDVDSLTDNLLEYLETYLEDYKTCDRCGYGKSIRTDICSRCVTGR